MPTEIERKFLVIDERWRDAVTHYEVMRQGYLASNPTCSIRVRIAGERAYLNIKSATLGVQRHEFEYEVPVVEATAMLSLFCQDRCVEKVRYYVPHGEHRWEIDVFEGANQGLIVAEVELAAIDDPFTRPLWLGTEVSYDKRYYNVCLLDNPYNKWGNSA